MQNMPLIFENNNTQTLPCTASQSNALASLCKLCNIILNCAWDHQVAKEALPRRWKVRILAQAKKIRRTAVRCIANMRNMQNMFHMTNMFNMTNMTNMNPPFQICKTICDICKI
jgi:hypothetical protein